MIVAGLDVGSVATKLAILREKNILSQGIITGEGKDLFQNLKNSVKEMNLSPDDLRYIVATGIGRGDITFSQKKRSIALCLARGASYLLPSVRVVIDVGGENSTVIGLSERGELMESTTNDKCASGAGNFLLLLVKLLNMPLDKLSKVSLGAEKKVEFTSTCAVFIEQEVISYLHRDRPLPISDIVAGIYSSLATRIVGLAKRIGIKDDVMVCGGVARNEGFIKILEEGLGKKVFVPDFPEMVPGLGAALIAAREVQ